MCKIQIGLGVLAMPSNLATFGMGPGLAVIFFVGILATCQSSHGPDVI